MGMWQVPATYKDKKELRRFYRQLQKLREKIKEVFGDDIVEDSFGDIETRIEYALDTDWELTDN